MQGQKGVQDVTLAAKLRLLTTPFTSLGALHVIAVGGYGAPVTDYSPDFLPLSIGLASRRVFGRTTLSFQSKRGWYLNSSTGYTWRSNVRLNRSAYFTEGRLALSDEVRMPNLADYVIAAGYQRPGFLITLPYTTQRTLGGGDIRRQDMPFVSNRMNFSKLEARAQYTLPMFKVASVWLGASRVPAKNRSTSSWGRLPRCSARVTSISPSAIFVRSAVRVQLPGRCMNRRANAWIRTAPAHVAAHRHRNLVVGWMLHCSQ